MVANQQRPTAWVTGASRGLGRAIAFGLAAAGHDVALSATNTKLLEETASEIRDLGRRSLVLPIDVSNPDQVESAATRIADEWGRLDVCCVGAGVSPVFKNGMQITNDEWREILGINLDGAFWTMREAARVMKAAGTGGSIIAVSSVHGRTGGARLAAYSASKGGLETLVRALAVDWAKYGIRVNALAPGYFETDMTVELRENEKFASKLLERIPMDRFGKPNDLIPAMVFLATEQSAYVTGTVLVIDGGWTAW